MQDDVDPMVEKTRLFNTLSSKDQYELLRIKSLEAISLNAVRGYVMNIERFAARGLTMKMPEVYGKKDRSVYRDRPELIGRKARPPPLRVESPIFADIIDAGHYFSRDNILQEIDKMRVTASALNKTVDMLTDVDFPCDVFGSSFMMAPSSPYKDVVSHVINKEAVRKVMSQTSCTDVVSIWAENSKGLGRYAVSGIRSIIVFFTADYPPQDFEVYAGFARDFNPNVLITRVEYDGTLAELCELTSQQFISKYKLDRRSLFLSHFLPQAVHLGYQFAELACICLDSDSIANVIRISAPPRLSDAVQDSQSLMMYLLDNHCSVIRDNASYGFYDVESKSRISYSDHMCFRDTIQLSISFPSNVLKLRAVDFISSTDSKSNLKIIYMTENIPSVIETVSVDSSVDLSRINGLVDVLYLPSLLVVPRVIPSDGKLILDDVVYIDFPASKTVLTCQYNDRWRVLDVDYRSFSFLSRRHKIPEDLRVPYSSVPLWDNNFLIFPESTMLANTFSFSVETYLNSLFSAPVPNDVPPDIRICGIGWNPVLLRVVFDPGCNVIESQWQDIKIEKPPFSYNFEFASSKAIRRLTSFGPIDFYHSESDNIVGYDDVLMLFNCHFPRSSKEFIAYYEGCGQTPLWTDYE